MLRSRSFLLSCALACTLAIPSIASALLIDFEGGNHGDVFAGPTLTTADYTLTVEQRGSDMGPGVIFNTNTSGNEDLDLQFEQGWESGNIQDTDLGNVLIVQQGSADCSASLCNLPNDARRGGSFSFLLNESFQAFEFALVDIDLAENELAGSIRFFFREDGQPDIEVSVFSFDSFAAIAGVEFGNRSANRIQLGDVGGTFNGFEIDMGGSGAIDEIRLTQVPEPGTAALLCLGLLKLAGSRRGRARGR